MRTVCPVGLIGLVIAFLLCGCDLKTPAPATYELPREEVLSDLPFYSSSTVAIAWHPDGQRLAVAEKRGVENILTGLMIQNPSPRVLNLRLRSSPLRKITAIPGKRLLIGESAAGRLDSWSLDEGEKQRFFDERVEPNLWSLSATGEHLLFVPVGSTPQWRSWQYVNFLNGDEATFDSTDLITELDMLPDGSAAVLAFRASTSRSYIYRVILQPLPQGQPRTLLELPRQAFRISVSSDGKRFVFLRERAYGYSYDIMVYDLKVGLVDSILAIRRPLSDLVWSNDDRWLSTFHYGYSSDVYELRSYNLAEKRAVVLTQNLPFTPGSDQFHLFAIGDTLQFFTDSPARVGVFNRGNRTIETWLERGAESNSLRSLAWTIQGDQLFVHEWDTQGRSVFHLLNGSSSQSHVKRYKCTSTALHSNGAEVVLVYDHDLYLDKIAIEDLHILRDTPWDSAIVFANTGSSNAIGFIENDTLFRLIDLSTLQNLDDWILPANSLPEFQFIRDELFAEPHAFILPVSHTAQPNSDTVYRYYLYRPTLRKILKVAESSSRIFAVMPQQSILSILTGNRLRIIDLNMQLLQ